MSGKGLISVCSIRCRLEKKKFEQSGFGLSLERFLVMRGGDLSLCDAFCEKKKKGSGGGKWNSAPACMYVYAMALSHGMINQPGEKNLRKQATV